MIKIDAYSAKGTKLTKPVTLPKKFEEKENLALLAQAVHVYQDRSHLGKSKTKTRGEVALTTRKWYRQKGTGRARHGAKSAPIFVGGGTAHGPKGVKRTLTLPQKMRRKAYHVALSLKAKDKEMILVQGIKDWQKSKDVQSFLKKIAQSRKLKKNTKYFFVLGQEQSSIKKIMTNLKNVKVDFFANLNALKVFQGGFLIFDQEVFK